MSYNNWTKLAVAKLAEKLANDLKFNGSNPAELALGTIVTECLATESLGIQWLCHGIEKNKVFFSFPRTSTDQSPQVDNIKSRIQVLCALAKVESEIATVAKSLRGSAGSRNTPIHKNKNKKSKKVAKKDKKRKSKKKKIKVSDVSTNHPKGEKLELSDVSDVSDASTNRTKVEKLGMSKVSDVSNNRPKVDKLEVSKVSDVSTNRPKVEKLGKNKKSERRSTSPTKPSKRHVFIDPSRSEETTSPTPKRRIVVDDQVAV